MKNFLGFILEKTYKKLILLETNNFSNTHDTYMLLFLTLNAAKQNHISCIAQIKDDHSYLPLTKLHISISQKERY